MDLFTSLTRLKMAMNGGVLPPMMPLTPTAQIHLDADPSMTIGMGALVEDPERGIRCPVRGCGVYRHLPRQHFDSAHTDMGGAEGLLRLLSIPSSVSLVSTVHHARLVQRGHDLWSSYRQPPPRHSLTVQRKRKMRRARTAVNRTIGYQNLHDHCLAQLSAKLLEAAGRLGHSPTAAEFAALYGPRVQAAVERTFGSWNAGKAAVGLKVFRISSGGTKYEGQLQIVECFRAWFKAHGSLPVCSAVAKGLPRTPWLPSYHTVLRHFQVASWSDAMRQIAALLGVEGGRYGLPQPQLVVRA